MSQALLLYLALTGATLDEYHLARAIQGEGVALACPTLDCQQRVGAVLVGTVYARLDAGWCQSVRECVDGAYWGAATVRYPDWWALDAARYASKIGGTAKFVFSKDDLEKLGLDKSAALFFVENEEWGMYFY